MNIYIFIQKIRNPTSTIQFLPLYAVFCPGVLFHIFKTDFALLYDGFWIFHVFSKSVEHLYKGLFMFFRCGIIIKITEFIGIGDVANGT